MKFRPQRGSLEESLKYVVIIPPTRKALAEHLGQREGRVVVKPYAADDRIDWHTHLVTVGGQAVGFTDGPLEA